MKHTGTFCLVVVWSFFWRGLTDATALAEQSSDRSEGKSAAPFSQAVVVDDVPLAHTGQIFSMDTNGKVIGQKDPEKQLGKVVKDLDRILTAAGSGWSQVVKLNVYLKNEALRSPVERFLLTQFPQGNGPALTFVAGDLENPEALIAADAVAISTREEKVTVLGSATHGGMADFAILPRGPKIYVSGMADTNVLLAATRKTLEKLTSTAGHLGVEKKDFVQLKVFLQPISEAGPVRREIAKFFGGHAPPVVCVEWISPPPNPPVEIELIAAGKAHPGEKTDHVSFLTPPGTVSTKVFSRVARVNAGKQIYISALWDNGHEPGDVPGQTREIFKRLGQILQSNGGDFEHLVKATYYVSNDEASNQLNEIRPEFYNPQRPPAASKAKVRSIGLPGKAIMLDMIAAIKE